MASRIKGIVVEIGGDTTDLQKALQGVNGKIKSTQTQLKDVERLLKLDPKNTELLAQKQKLLASAVSDTKDKLKTLKTAAASAAEEMKSGNGKITQEQYDALQREIVATEQDLRKLEDSAKKAGSSIKQSGSDAEASSGKFSTLAKSMGGGVAKGVETGVKAFSAYATAAAATGAAVGKSALDSYSDFESSISQVQATMGIAKDAMSTVDGQSVNTMDTLNALAKKMGAETAFSATECADALNYLALAGYDTQQMCDTLPTVLDLAAAGNIDLASASDMVTDAMSALGMGVDESEKMVDQMAKTASTTNTSVAQLGEGILTIGATAKSIKGGTAELNTALGILANNGIKGAEGGTNLRNIILSLQSPTDDAAAKMEKLGVKTYDSEGNMRSMNDILGDLNASMDGMTAAQKDDIIGTIFNKTDLAAVNSLLANTGDTWDNLQQTITDSTGSAAQMAGTQLDNLKGKITLFKSATEGAAIAIGDDLAPAAKEAVQAATDVVNAFNTGGLDAALKKVQEVVKKLATVVTTQLPTILPDLLSGFNALLVTLVQSIGTLIPPLITTVLPILLASFLDLITQIASYLATAAPLLLGSVISALRQVISTIEQNAPAIVSAVNALLQSVVTFVSGNLPLLLSMALTIVTQLATGLLAALPTLINAALQLVDGLAQGLIQNLPVLIDAALQLVQSLCDGLIQNLPQLIQAAVQIVLELVNGLLENLPALLDAALQMIDSLVQGLLGCLPQLVQAGINLVMGLVQGLIQNLPAILQATLQLITGITNSLLNHIPLLITTAMQLVTGIATGLVSAIPQLVAAIPQLVAAMVNGVMQTNWLRLGMDILKAILDGIMMYVSSLLGAWGSVFDQMLQSLIEWASNAWAKASESASNIFNAIVEGIKNLPYNFGYFVGEMLRKIVEFAKSAPAKAKEAASNIWNNIVETVKALPGKIGEFFSGAFRKIVEFATSAPSKAKEAASGIFDNIKNTLEELPDKMLEIGENIVTGIWNGITGATQWLKDKVSGFVDGIVDGFTGKEGFDSHSPSRRMSKDVGHWIPPGIGVGMLDNTKSALRAVSKVSDSIVSAAQQKIPDIVGSMGSISPAMLNAPATGGQINNFYDNSRTVNQTNNSPKALSRLEIYRQTKNANNL